MWEEWSSWSQEGRTPIVFASVNVEKVAAPATVLARLIENLESRR